MSTFTKVALGMVGRLRGRAAQGDAASSLYLPPPSFEGGVTLAQALLNRRSTRQFERTELPRCWIDTFERYGFYWLGRDPQLRDTMHFEFLGNPERIIPD